jgi:L-asparaginase
LETFGIGGIPDGFEETLFGWVDAGRTLVLTTQVPEEGLDLGVYEVGRAYAEHPGILLGDDMTVEALVAKTMWACGVASGQTQLAQLFRLPINHDRLA